MTTETGQQMPFEHREYIVKSLNPVLKTVMSRVLEATPEDPWPLILQTLREMKAQSPQAQAWSQRVLGFVKDARQKQAIEDFLALPQARKIIEEWVLPDVRSLPERMLTDMSDVYKASMVAPFAKIQRWMDKKHGKGKFVVRFTLNVRQSSELALEEVFRRACVDASWRQARDRWLEYVLEMMNRRFDVAMLRASDKALPPPLKGVLRYDEEMLQELERQAQQREVTIKVYLKVQGTPKKSWWEVRRDGSDYVAMGPDGKPQPLNKVVNELGSGFSIVCDAEGPWHLVTWFETPLIQATAETLGQGMQLSRGWSDEQFYAEGLSMLCQRTFFLEGEFCKDSNPFDVFLFAGRRSPHAGFHLLQNLWCLRCQTMHYKGTSSLFAYRVFRDQGWIGDDGKGTVEELKAVSMPLVGTHAHEGSMVFQAIAAAADDELQLPVSSVLWHLNYWLLTGVQAVLSDTMGSPAFFYLLESLCLPAKFVEEWNKRHGTPERRMSGDVAILEMLKRPILGGLIRQDSGSMEAYVQDYLAPPIALTFPPGGKPTWRNLVTNEATDGYKCLASEISKDEDVTLARSLGYIGIGTGGYLGEKPWGNYDKKLSTKPLSGRIDLVAKVSRVQLPSRKEFFPVKLGDVERKGTWHFEKPAKFAISPEVEGAGDGVAETTFKRFQRQGEVVNHSSRFYNVSNYPPEAILPKNFDADDGRQKRFEQLWDEFCFT